MDYDVLIAGAGICGLYTARELSKKGFKTAIFDSSKISGEPNFSTAGTTADLLEEFNLSQQGVSNEIKRFSMGTLNKEVSWDYDHTIAFTLDFRKTKQLLADEVISSGGEVFWGEKVNGLIMENNQIVGLNTGLDTLRKGKYIIDATGTTGILLANAGIRATSPGNPSAGIEIISKDKSGHLNKYKDTFAIYFDTEVIPYGYAWVFAHGTDTYKIGICEFAESPSRKLPALSERLNNFVEHITNLDEIEILEEHGHSIFVTDKMKVMQKDNLIGIGDAVGTINPILGEGIRHSLYSAKFAVEAIEANSKNNVNLNSYEKKWREYIGYEWKLSYFIYNILYNKNSKQTQSFYNELVNFMDNCNGDEALALAFDYVLPKAILNPFKNMRLILKLLLARIY